MRPAGDCCTRSIGDFNWERSSLVGSPGSRGRKRLFQIRLKIDDILKADLQAQERSLRGQPRHLAIVQVYVKRKAWKTAPGIAQSEQRQAVEKCPCPGFERISALL